MEQDLSLFCQPLEVTNDDFPEGSLGAAAQLHAPRNFPDLDEVQLAIIGVQEGRGAVNNHECSEAPNIVREYLYNLMAGPNEVKLADLGNILPGETIQDTYFAVANAVEYLVRKQIIPIIIGGGQDLTYANYAAYERLEQVVNIVCVDNQFDLGTIESDLNSRTYLNRIIIHQPNYLFNYSNLGYQTYFINQEVLKLMNKLFFDVYRLGEVRADLKEVEPVVRNADILSFDVGAIRQSDAPGNNNATPNGFYGEEACQIARYAGMSDKLSSIGFYEINPVRDPRGQTAHLVAQMIWYFLDGYHARKRDFPVGNKKDFLKYHVELQEVGHQLVFYKSKKSDRWWMDVPYPPNKRLKYERHHLVPCSYADYETALSEEMPDKWWQTYQKLS